MRKKNGENGKRAEGRNERRSEGRRNGGICLHGTAPGNRGDIICHIIASYTALACSPPPSPSIPFPPPRPPRSEDIACVLTIYFRRARSAEVTVLLLLLTGWESRRWRGLENRKSQVSDYLVKTCISATFSFMSCSHSISSSPSLSRSLSLPTCLSPFYGYINMAINVQAAPFVNTTLHKQKNVPLVPGSYCIGARRS